MIDNKNPAAAFPTANWVCALRAIDARQVIPKIGSNIQGAGPDLAAQFFAGDIGFQFVKDQMQAVNTKEEEAVIVSLQNRTMIFDEAFMKSYGRGIRQFVIVAAGLDARAWRLPFDKNTKLFELDVPEALAYKKSLIANLDACYPNGPSCERIEIPTDMSKESWVDALIESGFDITQPSHFINEGLHMYLEPGQPERLFQLVQGLMAPGSVLQGDALVGKSTICDAVYIELLEKYGTKWTHYFRSVNALEEALTSTGLSVEFPPISIVSLVALRPPEHCDSDPSNVLTGDMLVEAAAATIASMFDNVESWAEMSRFWIQSACGDGSQGNIDMILHCLVTDASYCRIASLLDDAGREKVLQLLKTQYSLETRIPEFVKGLGETTDEGKDSGYYFYSAIRY